MAMTKSWTEEEEGILKENYLTKTIDELLALLPGKTPSAIYGRAFVLRLSKKGDDDMIERRQRVKVLLQEGFTQAGIASELDVALSTIQNDVRMLKKEGFQPPPRPKKEPKPPRPKKEKEKVVMDYSVRLKAWERRVICDFGSTLGLVELKMLLPRMTKDQIIESATALGIKIKGC